MPDLRTFAAVALIVLGGILLAVAVTEAMGLSPAIQTWSAVLLGLAVLLFSVYEGSGADSWSKGPRAMWRDFQFGLASIVGGARQRPDAARDPGERPDDWQRATAAADAPGPAPNPQTTSSSRPSATEPMVGAAHLDEPNLDQDA